MKNHLAIPLLSLVMMLSLLCSCAQNAKSTEASVLDSLTIGDDLGPVLTRHYKGELPAADCPGIIYDLTIYNQEYCGNGVYSLSMTYLEAEQGKDVTFCEQGRQLTLRGDAVDIDAVVVQLIPFDSPQHPTNFVLRGDSLTMLNSEMRPNDNGLNYTLKRL